MDLRLTDIEANAVMHSMERGTQVPLKSPPHVPALGAPGFSDRDTEPGPSIFRQGNDAGIGILRGIGCCAVTERVVLRITPATEQPFSYEIL
jgi:hypothetical protein